MQICCAESLLASFLFLFKFLWRKFRWCGFATVLSMITLQAPLDRAHGELSSDTRTLISHGKSVKFVGPTEIIINFTSLVAIYFSEMSNIRPVRVSKINREIWHRHR